jgi:AcrR family transcriptional regulator
VAIPKRSRKKAPRPEEVSPRIARRERRRERSREEIIDAAKRVIAKHGVGGTTLDAVASEIGLTKAALYYYFPSKDALFFELVYEALARNAQSVADAVTRAPDGSTALGSIVRETIRDFATNLDDFRLVFLMGQVVGGTPVRFGPEHLAKIRPLNDLTYGGTAKRLEEQWEKAPGRAKVNARLMSFLANAAAVGILTYKGLVESQNDPLKYSDDELMEGLARIFEAAAAP